MIIRLPQIQKILILCIIQFHLCLTIPANVDTYSSVEGIDFFIIQDQVTTQYPTSSNHLEPLLNLPTITSLPITYYLSSRTSGPCSVEKDRRSSLSYTKNCFTSYSEKFDPVHIFLEKLTSIPEIIRNKKKHLFPVLNSIVFSFNRTFSGLWSESSLNPERVRIILVSVLSPPKTYFNLVKLHTLEQNVSQLLHIMSAAVVLLVPCHFSKAYNTWIQNSSLRQFISVYPTMHLIREDNYIYYDGSRQYRRNIRLVISLAMRDHMARYPDVFRNRSFLGPATLPPTLC